MEKLKLMDDELMEGRLSDLDTALAVRGHKMVAGHEVRVAMIDGVEYVSREDFSGFVRDAVNRIVAQSRQHTREATDMAQRLDVLQDALAERYPEVEREIMALLEKRLHMA